VTAAPVALLALACVLLWIPASATWRVRASLAALAAALGTSLWLGQSTPAGVGLLVLLALGCRAAHARGAAVRVVGYVFAIGVALLIGFAGVRLFSRLTLFADWSGVQPYSGSLGKAAAGALVLALVARRWDRSSGVARAVAVGVVAGVAVAVLLASVGLATGYLQEKPAPGAASALVFAFGNLLFAVMPEEALFRGLVQAPLARVCVAGAWRLAPIVISAIAFGLVHLPGGAMFAALAAVAGLANAAAYAISGRIEAPLASHLTLNVIHFVFFK
jgi:membrane protease YdiL (CAAX protease family)